MWQMLMKQNWAISQILLHMYLLFMELGSAKSVNLIWFFFVMVRLTRIQILNNWIRIKMKKEFLRDPHRNTCSHPIFVQLYQCKSITIVKWFFFSVITKLKKQPYRRINTKRDWKMQLWPGTNYRIAYN